MVGAIIALGAAFALSEFARRNNAQKLNIVAAELAETREVADAALRAVISPDIVEMAQQSVYQIQNLNKGRLLGHGTAFVVDQERGILVTNAHVAIEFYRSNAELAIQRHGMTEKIQVRNVKIHAGYGQFRRLVETYAPIRMNELVDELALVELGDLSFDVGLLFVEPLDPETGEYVLGPALQIAGDEALLKLKNGDPISIIGYPNDRMDSGADTEQPTFRVVRGIVSAIVSPLSRSGDVNPALSNLIAHRMETARGNSGSPVIDGNGLVVGVHSHGAVYQNESTAQRADAVRDLLEPLREELRLSDLFVPDWKATLEQWAKAEDIVPWAIYFENTTDAFGRDDMTVKEALEREPPFRVELSQRRFTSFNQPSRPFLLPAEDLVTQDDSEDGNEDEEASIEPIPVFRLGAAGDYYSRTFDVSSNDTFAIFAYDYAISGGPSHCSLSLFARFLDEDTIYSFEPGAGDLYTAVVISPVEDAADTEDETYMNIVVRRDARQRNGEPTPCDTRSRNFSLGIMKWPTNTSNDIATAALQLDPHHGKSITTVNDAPATIRMFRAAHCMARPRADECRRAKIDNWAQEYRTRAAIAASHAETP